MGPTIALIVFGLIVILAIVTVIRTVVVIQQGNVGVVKRLGEFHSVRPAGITFLIPYLDVIGIVDVREAYRHVNDRPAFLAKPFEMKTFLATVRDAIGS